MSNLRDVARQLQKSCDEIFKQTGMHVTIAVETKDHRLAIELASTVTDRYDVQIDPYAVEHPIAPDVVARWKP